MGKSLCVYYQYRDAGNYKRHGQVVLANPTGVSPATLSAALVAAFPAMQTFPDVVAFDPEVLGWPCLFFVGHGLEGEDVCHHEVELIDVVDGGADADRGVEGALRRLGKLRGIAVSTYFS